MEKLDPKYQSELDTLREEIQNSELLATYLDDEEESSYQALRDEFEPRIEELYERVAEVHPLQLTTLETMLLPTEFEGLYLSRVLGFSVLRGEVDEDYHYRRPQDHFKAVLLAIADSSNFEWIKNKIGQGCQIGFALSSEIWVSNLVNQVENKKVRQFYESMILDKLRALPARKQAYDNYYRQFVNHNYHSADFPKNVSELKTLFSALEKFIQYRIRHGMTNMSLLPNFQEFLNNEDFKKEEEYLRMLILFSRYFPHEGHEDWIKKLFNDARVNFPGFNEKYFNYVLEIEEKGLPLDKESDLNIFNLLDSSIDDDLLRYSKLINEIHQKGYIHEDAIESIRNFYDNHEGLSDINECLRHTIYGNFERLISNIPIEDYKSLTGQDQRKAENEDARDDSIAKFMKLYMDIFANQEFNLRLRDLSMTFIDRTLKQFTDKRSTQYQDIKHFVMDKFPDWEFMREKEVVELFKTRRKRKPVKAEVASKR
ncbi:MAG TPA: hypothetical protein VMZ69_10540 [Saprospiraceae bacterium]|nr:hypothetical protein [Saprospiraceae bacterium]